MARLAEETVVQGVAALVGGLHRQEDAAVLGDKGMRGCLGLGVAQEGTRGRPTGPATVLREAPPGLPEARPHPGARALGAVTGESLREKRGHLEKDLEGSHSVGVTRACCSEQAYEAGAHLPPGPGQDLPGAPGPGQRLPAER